MYCDRCGTQFSAGAQFCANCGRAIVGGVAAPAAGQRMGQASGSTGTYGEPAEARGEGRVQRHVRTLALLWAINGVLRLMGVAWMTIFGTMFFPFMRGWARGMVGPFAGKWGLDIPFLGGLFSVGIFLGLFGVLHLVLAWGLFERQPWARTLGLVIGFLALLRFPLGTALGIYTLWVLLPEESGREYDRLAQGDGRMNSAAVSS